MDYDAWKLGSPLDDIKCPGGCGEDWDLCTCEAGPRKYTRADYEADRADMMHSDGEL